jgi:hypothetical protein
MGCFVRLLSVVDWGNTYTGCAPVFEGIIGFGFVIVSGALVFFNGVAMSYIARLK